MPTTSSSSVPAYSTASGIRKTQLVPFQPQICTPSAYADRLRQLLGQAKVVIPAKTPRVVPEDSQDDKFVAAALAANAVLITNDDHLLAVAGHRDLRVMRPADLVRLRWAGPRE